jgi:hypothetical protein
VTCRFLVRLRVMIMMIMIMMTMTMMMMMSSCRQLELEGPGVSQAKRWALKKDLARKKADRIRAIANTGTGH